MTIRAHDEVLLMKATPKGLFEVQILIRDYPGDDELIPPDELRALIELFEQFAQTFRLQAGQLHG